jgi:ElaA protein
MEITWKVKEYSALSLDELYQILKLRSEVFVVEQNCFYQDVDGKDQACYHVMGSVSDLGLVAYTRLVPPGLSYSNPSKGRVVVAAEVRKNGTGKELLIRSIDRIEEIYGKPAIEISAQLYLKRFYESFGFRQEGEPYLEAGIEHIHMTRAVDFVS